MKTSPFARLSAGQSLSVISSDATSMPSPPTQTTMPASCVQWYRGRMYSQQKKRQTGIAHASRSMHESSVV